MSKEKFNPKVLRCAVNETHLMSQHVFTPYKPSLALIFH